MRNPKQKAKSLPKLILLFASISAIVFPAVVHGKIVGDDNTIGLWHMDEVIPTEHRETIYDATEMNPGTLIPAPTSPVLVESKFGNALKFDGNNGVYVPIRFIVGFPPSPEPIYIPISTSLDVQKDIRVEAWINVQAFKEASYNNVVVKCTRRDSSSENVTRIFGLAIKPALKQNDRSIQDGILSGCVFTDTEGFNEIVTKEAVIPLNEWVHIAFTRSVTTGMHLYVNGIEKAAAAIYGTQNPKGSIINGTEVYFGHDSIAVIDEIRISNLSPESETVMAEIDIGPNMLAALIGVTVILSVALILRKAIQMWAIRPKP